MNSTFHLLQLWQLMQNNLTEGDIISTKQQLFQLNVECALKYQQQLDQLHYQNAESFNKVYDQMFDCLQQRFINIQSKAEIQQILQTIDPNLNVQTNEINNNVNQTKQLFPLICQYLQEKLIVLQKFLKLQLKSLIIFVQLDKNMIKIQALFDEYLIKVETTIPEQLCVFFLLNYINNKFNFQFVNVIIISNSYVNYQIFGNIIQQLHYQEIDHVFLNICKIYQNVPVTQCLKKEIIHVMVQLLSLMGYSIVEIYSQETQQKMLIKLQKHQLFTNTLSATDNSSVIQEEAFDRLPLQINYLQRLSVKLDPQYLVNSNQYILLIDHKSLPFGNMNSKQQQMTKEEKKQTITLQKPKNKPKRQYTQMQRDKTTGKFNKTVLKQDRQRRKNQKDEKTKIKKLVRIKRRVAKEKIKIILNKKKTQQEQLLEQKLHIRKQQKLNVKPDVTNQKRKSRSSMDKQQELKQNKSKTKSKPQKIQQQQVFKQNQTSIQNHKLLNYNSQTQPLIIQDFSDDNVQCDQNPSKLQEEQQRELQLQNQNSLIKQIRNILEQSGQSIETKSVVNINSPNED